MPYFETGTSQEPCIVCGQTAKVVVGGIEDPMEVPRLVECTRCGTYVLTETAKEEIETFTTSEKTLVSVAIRRASENGLRVDFRQQSANPLLQRTPATIGGKVRLLLELLSRRSQGIGNSARLSLGQDYPAIEATSPQELELRLDYLDRQGWTNELARSMGADRSLTITPEGWAELERPGADGIVRDRVFMALSFKEEMNEPYTNGIRAGIEDCRCDPRCLKDIVHTEDINSKILAEIALAEFVVADVTHHSNGVYFEAGYAMALGRPVLFTCHEGHQDDCHFDTSHYPHLFWKTPEELRGKLAAWLGALIGRRPPGRRASGVG